MRPLIVSLLTKQQLNKGAPWKRVLWGGRRHYSRSTPNNQEQSSEPTTLTKIASWIRECTSHAENPKADRKPNILVLCGAGVSVSAGIPDFRTPGTGLYDNLKHLGLEYPELVFDLNYFREQPQAFMSLARDIWPGLQQEQRSSSSACQNDSQQPSRSLPPPSPTLTHSFLALLERKNALLRCYTQNIDGLEVRGGVSPERMVECHGHFRTASCIHCGLPASIERMKRYVLRDPSDPAVSSPLALPGQPPICESCHIGYVKPDIVFFGEALPDRVFEMLGRDLEEADLLIILGTSLQVAPVSMIPNQVSGSCRRVLLNRELVGRLNVGDSKKKEPRDLFFAGDCDSSVQAICEVLNWEEELLQQNKVTRSE